MIKSHVYLPKSILNRFSQRDKDGKKIINYYNFDTKKIENATTTSFNRKLGYYTDENEVKLKTFSEEKIGNVIKELEENFKSNGLNFVISNNSKKVIKKYVSYQLIRDDSIMQMIKDTLSNINYNANYLSIEEKKRRFLLSAQYKKMSLKQLKNYFIEIEESLTVFFSTVNELGIVIMFNETNKDYLLTSSTSALNPYSKGYFMMNITLTPKISVMLCNKNTLKNEISINDDFYLSKVSDDKFVDDYNKELYNVAIKNKPNILVGSRKELEIIIQK